MAVASQALEREVNKNTDLTVFAPADLDSARIKWLILLADRMRALEQARADVRNQFDHGGAAAVVDAFYDLENDVDEARRMVCALSSEMRRRSEGEIPIWKA